MSVYAEDGYSTGISSSVRMETSDITARQQRIKALAQCWPTSDRPREQVVSGASGVGHHLGQGRDDRSELRRACRAPSALRPAHLRHTTERVNGISEALSDVLNRLDI